MRKMERILECIDAVRGRELCFAVREAVRIVDSVLVADLEVVRIHTLVVLVEVGVDYTWVVGKIGLGHKFVAEEVPVMAHILDSFAVEVEPNS